VPELPEVEVLVRNLRPLVKGQTIATVTVSRPRVCAPTSRAELKRALTRATFLDLTRRGKYLIFTLRQPHGQATLQVLGHLGMTGKMYLHAPDDPLPKHAAVVLGLNTNRFIFEDTRYFGRFTLDTSPVKQLGPEPLSDDFSPEYFQLALSRSAQSIKPKLLDQSLVAGIGNIYASEALFRAEISPKVSARRLSTSQVLRLWTSVREVLNDAIQTGSSLALNFGNGKGDGLFYFGGEPGKGQDVHERFRVYDRKGEPCVKCGKPILRRVQAGRSTFYCAECQRIRPKISRRRSKSN
jgi:formamidopyrimidine-DNA glycosylase